MRTFRPTLAAAAVALLVTGAGCSGSASAQFSNAYIFGDSLSDAGQYGARFTTNPGLTFPMYLAQRYGITVSPSFTGGTDFGQGGARVNAPSAAIPSSVRLISSTGSKWRDTSRCSPRQRKRGASLISTAGTWRMAPSPVMSWRSVCAP